MAGKRLEGKVALITGAAAVSGGPLNYRATLDPMGSQGIAGWARNE